MQLSKEEALLLLLLLAEEEAERIRRRRRNNIRTKRRRSGTKACVLLFYARTVPAVGPRLGAEARRRGAHVYGQLLPVQDRAAVQVRERHLRGRDQEPVLAVHAVVHLKGGNHTRSSSEHKRAQRGMARRAARNGRGTR